MEVENGSQMENKLIFQGPVFHRSVIIGRVYTLW